MRARVLKSYQREELDSHLRAQIPDAGQRGEALRRIGIAYSWASLELAGQRAYPGLRGEWAKEKEKFRKHFSRMAEQARALRASLEWHAPKAQEISWKSLSAALELLEASAAEEEDSLRPAANRPITKVWRDSLFAVADQAYPSGAKKGEHLRETVRILLNFLADAGLLPADADERTNANVLKVTIQNARKRPVAATLRVLLEQAK
ncbi:hypothetical protein NR798_28670 [Archangium gephyra]|uniref:hypothetical protein n=1 Tax=Archangium gephyra TaxID=48 RepID=UPI0035D3F85D